MGWDWSQGGRVITDDEYSPLHPSGGPGKLDEKMTPVRWPGLTRNEVKELLGRAHSGRG